MSDLILHSQNFEFIRPLLLLGLLPVFVLYALILKYGSKNNPWQTLIPSHLYQPMVVTKTIRSSRRFIHFAGLSAVIAVLAAAGPSWEKLPQAVYQTQAGKVILMDMSMSMRATDLKPDRLTRARFKAIDLISEISEGETGLIVYAGDAFVVSPLTDDGQTLTSLIPSLKPEIMPSQGSSALLGLEKAEELLINAGYKTGHIYWITDGIIFDEIQSIRRFLNDSQFEISALLIGTEEGAPIQLQDGTLLKDPAGRIVVPSINARYLDQALAGTSASFSEFTADNSDILSIKRKIAFEQKRQAEEVENTSGDTNKDMGPYLVLLLLPIAAYAFRKGILSVAFVCVFVSSGDPVFAAQAQTSEPTKQTTEALETHENATALQSNTTLGLMKSWFKNADQQGKQAYDSEDYNRASELFKNKQWQAASAYKKGDFEEATRLYKELLQQDVSVDPVDNTALNAIENRYNLGNALAKSGQLEQAIEAYDEVLTRQPEHEAALKNKQIVEDLLNQQQQDQENQNQQDNNQESHDQQNQEQQNQDQQSQDQQNSDQGSEQSENSDQNSDQNSEQQSSEEQGSEQENQDNQQQNGQQQDQDQQNRDDEALKQQAQQQSQEQEQNSNSEQQASDAQNQNAQSKELENQEQQAAISNQAINMDDLTPEQKEEMQRLQMILNKVPDDPAYLLQRKMLLESYKRKTPPPPTHENW